MRKITLGEVCNIEKGKIGIQAAIPGKYPLVTTGVDRASHNEYHFQGEAVCIPLVSGTGHGHASIKRLHYEQGKFCVGSILAACIPKDNERISAKFLYLYLSLLKDEILVPLMQGSANVSLKIKDLLKVEVPDISINRQLAIVNQFDNLFKKQGALLTEIDSQLTDIQLLRQTILQEAVQGKLVPQDANDEPATELLKKIQAEKEQLVKQGKIKKPKPLPPVSEDEIPYELPKGWLWCRLGEICNVGTGATPLTSKPEYYKGDIAWITSSATGQPFVFEPEKYITEIAVSETNCKVYPKGTLIVAMYGQGKTRGQITELMIDAATNQACAGLELYNTDEQHKKYLKFFFQKIYLEIRELAAGGAQPNLNLQKIKETIVPLPPHQEQKRIVAKIEQLMQLCNKLEAQVQQSKADAEQLLQAVLREAFEGKATSKVIELPQPTVAAESEVEYGKKSRKANWEFKEAVLISILTEKFGSLNFPLGRKRYTKLSYLFHRHVQDQEVKRYLRKAAGPYNPNTRYKGPEGIALSNKYVSNSTNGKLKGFVAGENIDSAKEFYSRYWDSSHIEWLEQFRYKKNDELELYTTVDNALLELYESGKSITVEHIKDIIKKEPEWEEKLNKPVFSDSNIQASINLLSNLFSYSDNQGE